MWDEWKEGRMDGGWVKWMDDNWMVGLTEGWKDGWMNGEDVWME